jgi:hypothetical protein
MALEHITAVDLTHMLCGPHCTLHAGHGLT